LTTYELLKKQAFSSLEELQETLDRYLTYYNNYRLHSALRWKTPASRYTGQMITIRGLAGIPGIEPMASDSRWGPSYCDPPPHISPFTALNSSALAVLPSQASFVSSCP